MANYGQQAPYLVPPYEGFHQDVESQQHPYQPGPQATPQPNNGRIPLICTLCPRSNKFSDVSHLLTHLNSKGHIATYHNQNLLKAVNPSIAAQLVEYDRWYRNNGIEVLLRERLTSKGEKPQQDEGSSPRGGTGTRGRGSRGGRGGSRGRARGGRGSRGGRGGSARGRVGHRDLVSESHSTASPVRSYPIAPKFYLFYTHTLLPHLTLSLVTNFLPPQRPRVAHSISDF